jgi:hypothetical protein
MTSGFVPPVLRQFGAALWPPGMRVLWDVCAPLSLRRACSRLYNFKMNFGRGLCIGFLLLRHEFSIFINHNQIHHPDCLRTFN